MCVTLAQKLIAIIVGIEDDRNETWLYKDYRMTIVNERINQKGTTMTEPERNITRLHNNPPSDEEILQAELAKNYAEDVQAYETAVLKEASLPPEVNSDEENGKYSDYDKELSRIKSALESFRKKEKAPHSAKVAVIDSFFKSKTDNIKAIDERIGEKMKKYLKAKEDAKRRAAEEKAAAEREEAARKLKEAEAAQKAAEEAERAAKAEAERIQREADESRRKAEAEAAAARKKAEDEAAALRQKAEDDRKKAAAAEAEVVRLKEEARNKEARDAEQRAADKAKIEAAEEARKQAERDAKAADKEAKETLATADKEAKEIQKELKAELKEADATIAGLHSEVKTLNREANHALDDAARQDKAALKAERVADGKSSDFSRTRGAASLSSTSDYWTGHMTDLDALDLEALRYHIPLDALDKAIKSCVRAGNRQIAGASIYEETRLNNR